MRKEIFAVCDPELFYIQKLTEFIYEKYGSVFEVQAFTGVRSLCDFAVKNQVSLLLIAAHVVTKEVQELPIEKIIVLSEGDIIERLTDYPAVYKYQASANMVAEVMEHYTVEKKPRQLLKPKMRLIGVYSPVSRVLKTSFALGLGQILARDKAVLYLNLESYSGFEHLLKRDFTSDFSDLMFLYRSRRENLVYKIQGMVQNLDNLDYLPPFFYNEDLKSIDYEEWAGFLELLEQYSIYETVILDIGEGVSGIFQLLQHCDRIFMPVREDSLSCAKLFHYEKILAEKGYQDIPDKTRKLKLPFHNSFGKSEYYTEQLLWGEFGDFIKELIRTERMENQLI